jgi:hypothetical protein
MTSMTFSRFLLMLQIYVLGGYLADGEPVSSMNVDGFDDLRILLHLQSYPVPDMRSSSHPWNLS